MKSDRIILIAVFVLLVFTLRTSAASSYDTTTTLTIPALDVGVETTLSTTTTYSDGNVFMGGIDYFALEDTTTLGFSKSSTTTLVSTPRITFTPSADLPFWVIRIPILSIGNLAQIDSDIGWVIKQGSSSIISGEFETNVIPQMLADNALVIVVNSDQTSSTSKITLQAATEYIIEINDNDGLTYSFDTQTSGSPLLHDGSTSTGNSVQLVIYDGVHIGNVDTFDGTTAIQYTPSSSVNHIIAYYGYATGNFGSSYDFSTVTVSDDPDYALTMSDVWGYQNNQITIQAILKENSNAKSGETVEFDLLMDGFYLFLGSDTTDGNGIASITYTIDLEYGNYSIRARIQLPSSQIDTLANLEVKKTVGNFESVVGEGNFGSSSGNSSAILISGYLKTDNQAAIPDVVVELWDSSAQLLSNTTTSTGYFEMTYHQLLSVGTHSDYWLKSSDPDYDITETPISIEIYQGQPQIELNTTSIETTYGEDVGIEGTVKDESGDPLTADIILEKFEGSWTFVDSREAVSGFEFPIDTSITGQHTLRVRFYSTDTDFASTTQQISLQVDKADAIINLDNTHYDIEYNNKGQITVDVTDTTGNPLDGVDVSLYYANYSDSSDFLFYQTITSTGGQVIFDFDPTSEYDTLPYFYYDLIVSGNSDTHNFTSVTAKFQIVATDLTATIRSTDYVYGKISDVIFDTVDNGGAPGKSGEELLLYYSDQQYVSQIQVDGSATFVVTFAEIGSVDITVGYKNATNFPYNTFNQTISVTVDKAYHSISTQSVNGSQGETIKFTADLYDENDDPTDVSVNFYIYTIDWSFIGSNTSVNGKFIYNYFIPSTMGIGTYQIKYEVPASANYYLTEEITTLDITSVLTKIEISGPSLYQYNSDITDRTYTATLSTMDDLGLSSKTLDIEFGSYSTSVLTDDNGVATFSLPKLITPGTYDLIVDYIGDETYTSASQIRSIEVNGTDVFYDWITQPTDTKYGDYMTIELGLYDAYQYLSDKEISIYVDGVFSASKPINSSGYVTFSIQMLFVQKDLTVEVRFDATDGWNAHSESFDIIQGDKFMDAQSFTPDLTNVTYYDAITQILLYTENQNSPEAGVSADLYLYDTSAGTYSLIYSGSTNSSGYLLASLDLPTQSAGTIYQLQWRMNQLYFQETILDFDLAIQQETPLENVSETNSVVLNDTIITFEILDRDGDPIDGIRVNLVYAPIQVEYSETQEVINGQVTFIFIPQTSGQHILSYTIFDDNGNYAEVSDSIVFDVIKDDPNLIYQLRDEAGQGVIYLEIVGSASNRTITATMTTYIDTQVQGTISVDGLLRIEFSMNATSHRFEFLVSSSDQITNGYLSLSIIQEDVSITTPDSGIYAHVPNQLSVPVSSDNSTLEGHTILLFVETDSGWTQISTGTIIDNNAIFDINYLLDKGNHNFKFFYPEQAWFAQQEKEFTLDIEKQTPTISFEYDEFIYNKQVNLTLYLIDKREIGIDTIHGSISIFDGSWIELYAGDLSHNTTYSLLIKQSLGEYDVRITTSEDQRYLNGELIQSVTVKQNTNLRVMYQTTAFYSDGNEVFLLLVEPETGAPVVDQTISVYECPVFCSSKEFMVELQTNSSGIAVFSIPPDYTPDLYTFIAIYESSDNYSKSSLEFEVQVVPEQIQIIPTIIDYGITHNITITIDIVDESGSIAGKGFIVISIGNLQYNHSFAGSPITLTYYDLIGKEELIIEFVPELAYYTFSDYTSTIGWDRISDVDVVVKDTLGYGDDFFAGFASNQTLLHHLDVTIYISNPVFGTTNITKQMMTHYGTMSFVWLFRPASYAITIRINNATLFSGETPFVYEYQLKVTTGNRPFSMEFEEMLKITPVMELNISDVVPSSNYTIVVYNGTRTWVFSTTNTTILLSFDGYLEPGTYRINVTRAHGFMHPVIIQSQFKVVPYEITEISVQETTDYLYFSFDNYRPTYPMVLLISITNKTHTFNFTLTTLSMQHNLDHGAYQLFYYFSGYYRGNGSVSIDIPEIEASTTESESPTPLDYQVGAVEKTISGILLALGVGGLAYYGFGVTIRRIVERTDKVSQMPKKEMNNEDPPG